MVVTHDFARDGASRDLCRLLKALGKRLYSCTHPS